jgi:hypothetical protein
VFTHPTIGSQAALLEDRSGEGYAPIPEAVVKADYVLSAGQRRLWVLDQMESQGSAYLMSLSYVLEGRLEVDHLISAVDYVVSRHEILRTRIEEREGEPRQVIGEQGPKVSLMEAEGEELWNLADRFVNTRFDLSAGPLLRVGLMKERDKDRYVLLLSMHHIISDGWSMEVLISELLSCYRACIRGEQLNSPPLRIQYKDYAEWQQAELSGWRYESHRKYWLSQFSDGVPVLEFPRDYARAKQKTFNGKLIEFRLTDQISSKITSYCHETNLTSHALMLGVVNMLLFFSTRQSRFIIGLPLAGRDHPELENQIGYYVNLVPFVTQIIGNESILTFLRRISQQVLHVHQHQHYPFDQLLLDVGVERSANRLPLFDIGFTWNQTVLSGESNPVELAVATVKKNAVIAKRDIWFYGTFSDGIFDMAIEYNSDLFSDSRMSMLRHRWEKIISLVLENATLSVEALTEQLDREMNVATGVEVSLKLNI